MRRSQTVIYVDPEVLATLDRLAASENVSRNTVTRRLLDEALEARGLARTTSKQMPLIDAKPSRVRKSA